MNENEVRIEGLRQAGYAIELWLKNGFAHTENSGRSVEEREAIDGYLRAVQTGLFDKMRELEEQAAIKLVIERMHASITQTEEPVAQNAESHEAKALRLRTALSENYRGG